jgi:hypothetical protein
LDRETLNAWLCRRTLRDSPALQDTIQLQPKVPVEPSRVVLLN